eukprot:COSAG01_NODE_370_length_18018_cov_142.063620_26_plen_65_part_00
MASCEGASEVRGGRSVHRPTCAGQQNKFQRHPSPLSVLRRVDAPRTTPHRVHSRTVTAEGVARD